MNLCPYLSLRISLYLSGLNPVGTTAVEKCTQRVTESVHINSYSSKKVPNISLSYRIREVSTSNLRYPESSYAGIFHDFCHST